MSDIELAGIVAEDDAVAQEAMRLDAAPQRTLGGDARRIGRDGELGDAKLVEVGRPCGVVAREGDQFFHGDVHEGVVHYQVLCRTHYRRGQLRAQ